MPLVLGIDLGTTTLTALAVEAASGEVVACRQAPNAAETTTPADRRRGRSEWDAEAIVRTALLLVRQVSDSLDPTTDVVGIGVTGQQHGVVIVDENGEPLTPFVNWQDRRGEDSGVDEGVGGETYVDRALRRVGPEAPARTGCPLASGFMGVTLFWMKETGTLPRGGCACFLTDYFTARLTDTAPTTDPSNGAGSGLLDVVERKWEGGLIAALGLPRTLFPEVREAGDLLGRLSPVAAAQAGLPAGTPVFVGLGDNQASFLGSVADRRHSVLVNVGTGGQVSAFNDDFRYAPPLETRPFPHSGYLLVEAGLCGGGSYAALERFFRQVGREVSGAEPDGAVYEVMNRLARRAPPGAAGVRCEPFFTGTRFQPELRAQWSGLSDANFTPENLTRSLLEGIARTFRQGGRRIQEATGVPVGRLVGSGNGLRENPVLAELVAGEFGLPLLLPRHREEAAFGAALIAACGAGLFPDLDAAGRIVRTVRALDWRASRYPEEA